MAGEPPEKPDEPSLDSSQEEVEPGDGETIEGPEASTSEQDSAESDDEPSIEELISSLVDEQDEHSIEVNAETSPSVDALSPSSEHPQRPEFGEPPAGAPEDDTASGKEEAEPYTEEALDALLTQMNASPEEEDSREDSPRIGEAEQTAEEDTLDEGQVDSLLTQVDQALDAKEESFKDQTGKEVKPGIEEGPSEEEVPPDVAPQPDDAGQVAESLSEEELDTVLAGEDSEKPLDERSLDTVLPESDKDSAANMDAPLQEVPDDSSEMPAPMADESADAQSPAPEAPPFDEESEENEEGEDVGSENLAAAGTVQERDDTDDAAQEAINALLNKSSSASGKIGAEDVKEAKPQADAAPEAAPAPETPKRRKILTLPRVPFSLLMKAGLSLAVGLVFGLATYVLLSNYETRTPDLEVPAVEQTWSLEQVLQRAGALMDTGDYAGAWRLLNGPLREAPPSPIRTQAEAMRIEAAYRSLEPEVAQFEAELVNSYIDTFLSHAESHPARPEVLRWKADIYERVGLPYAAYDVYNQLLSRAETVPGKAEILLRMGRLGLEMERYESAAEHLEELVKNYPETAQASEGKLLLGEAFARLGRQEEGEALLRQVAEANTHNRLGAQAYATLGRMAIDRGDYDAAINVLKRRLKTGTTSKGNDEILLMLAESYRATNQMQEAQDALRDIVRFFPESASTAQAYLELSEILDLMGKRDDALRIASEAAQAHPENPDVLLQYAKLRKLTGDSRGAAEALANAEEAGTQNPEVLLTAGNQFVKAGYPRQAKEAFKRLVAAFPGTPQAIVGSIALAKLAFESNEVGRALSMLEDLAIATEDTPQETEVLLALGSTYQELGLHERAAEAYRTVAGKSSEPEVLAKAAIALYASGAWAEGTEVARRVELERLTEPTAFRFLLDYGHAMLRADSGRGLELMEQAWAEYPEQRTMDEAERLLQTYLALDELDKALGLVDELAEEIEPANVDTFRELAIMCGDYAMDHEDYATAAEVYRTVTEVSPRETELLQWARFQLANALYAQGKTEESRPLFESVAASASSWATEAQLRLDYMELQARLNNEAGLGTQG